MKRLHLQILYGFLWVLAIGLFAGNVGTFREVAAAVGQARGIAWFMLFFGPAFFTLYLLTAFLFDAKEETVSGEQFKAFLYRRRLLVGLFIFSLILFVILTFYGVSFKR